MREVCSTNTRLKVRGKYCVWEVFCKNMRHKPKQGNSNPISFIILLTLSSTEMVCHNMKLRRQKILICFLKANVTFLQYGATEVYNLR
jgi:hypothetical protein